MTRIVLTVVVVLATGLAGWVGTSPPPSPPESPRWRELGAIQPRIAPDGGAVAFSYQGSIWRMPTAGGTMTRLTTDEGFDIEPAWSPDGKLIAYLSTPAMGDGTLRIIESGTGHALPAPKVPRIVGTVLYNKIHFHPDGQRILGLVRSEGKAAGLAWIDLASGSVTIVAQPPGWARYALSNDGQWVAYTVTMDRPGEQSGNNGPQAEVWKAPAGGGQPVKVLRFAARIYDLCFTADDRGLILVSDAGSVHNDLWLVPLSAPAAARKLTFGQADEDRPSVSSDGRWLLYCDNRRSSTALVLHDLRTADERALVADKLDFRTPTGSLRLRTLDEATSRPVTCRVWIKDSRGKYHAPVGALYRLRGRDLHFYCAGVCRLELPAGTYRVGVARGPECRTRRIEVAIAAGQTLEHTAAIERWIDAAAAGWHSGENHIHANYGYGEWYNTPQTMLEQCAGEDLRVCNFMVANSDTDAIFDREFFRGGLDRLSTNETLLYWNQEFRSTLWGHMTLANLQQLVEPIMTGFRHTTNPWDIPTNADIADKAHWQNGLVNYTHGAQNPKDPYDGAYTAKGIPVDVALGKIDTLDLNNSYQGTVPLWYRLLNCGFRLPATAGTDCFLNRVRSRLPGGDRAYVKIDGPFTYGAWIDGLRRGRSFVSNGPFIEWTANGAEPGAVLRFDGPGTVQIAGTVRSQFPLNRVEFIADGKVVGSAKLIDGGLRATLDQSVRVERSGWIAVRAAGPGHPEESVAPLFAHSNPIYAEIAGRPRECREEAAFFLAWIDRLALALRIRDRIPNDQLRKQVQEQLEAARKVYVELSRRGG